MKVYLTSQNVQKASGDSWNRIQSAFIQSIVNVAAFKILLPEPFYKTLISNVHFASLTLGPFSQESYLKQSLAYWTERPAENVSGRKTLIGCY